MNDRYLRPRQPRGQQRPRRGRRARPARGVLRRAADAASFAALRLMRLMSDVREAMWGVLQRAVSELDFDYGAYAAEHFARLRAEAADPRLEDWIGAAAA